MEGISLDASPAYRRRVLALLAGLLGVVGVYLVLLIGTTAMVVVPILAALGQPLWWPLAGLTALLGLPLGAFLLEALFESRPVAGRGQAIDASDQPRLVAFIAALAERLDAPMPERVSLGAGVNAAMVRGRSALGSVFGGRRELVLGLGLVNVLDEREFEAVLAHEFGHFAQSSTRLGQRAHQVSVALRSLATGRTRLDRRLARAEHSRAALVRGFAWLLGIGVRGARGLLLARLRHVARLNAALARELEFNADLHAVALCGSDALVSALWRAQRGAIAMQGALAGLAELSKHGLFSDDLYAHQDARLDGLDERLAAAGDPMSRALRETYVAGPELHFPPGDVPAELSWYAHPSYREREANAKQPYVAATQALAPRPAWALFDNAESLRHEATIGAYAGLGRAVSAAAMKPAPEVEARLATELDERRQDPRYHGYYDNRLVDLGDFAALLDELEASEAALEAQTTRADYDAWRGPTLATFMRAWQATDRALASAEPGERSAAEARRSAELEAARSGDRAVFRWLWRIADERRTELVERYDFTLWVQAQILVFNHHHALLARAFARFDAARCSRAADLPLEVVHILDQIHAELARVVDEAGARSLPELRNLAPGTTLVEALGAVEVPPALDQDDELGPWLRTFMAMVSEVHGRLRTLHYKNLGQLLRLQEAIEAQRLEAQADALKADGD